MFPSIHRSIEPVLKVMAGQFPAVAVTGPRQSGKSTLLQQVFPDHAYLTLDDPLVLQQTSGTCGNSSGSCNCWRPAARRR